MKTFSGTPITFSGGLWSKEDASELKISNTYN